MPVYILKILFSFIALKLINIIIFINTLIDILILMLMLMQQHSQLLISKHYHWVSQRLHMTITKLRLHFLIELGHWKTLRGYISTGRHIMP